MAEAMVGIQINGRVYYGSIKAIGQVKAKMEALKARSAQISQEIREARLGPSTHRNQLSAWLGKPTHLTSEQMFEVKLMREMVK
jgi:hypothetical protein